MRRISIYLYNVIIIKYIGIATQIIAEGWHIMLVHKELCMYGYNMNLYNMRKKRVELIGKKLVWSRHWNIKSWG